MTVNLQVLSKTRTVLNVVRVLNFSSRFPSSKMTRIKRRNEISTLEKRLTEFDDGEDYDETILAMDKIYDKHEREIEFKKNLSNFKIIQRKYFKSEKRPNFVSTAAKMQMKYLHSIDPERWNLEKLSQSFPATSEEVEKILKKNTHYWGSKRGKQYDKTVLQNWKDFRDGKGGPIGTAIEKIHDTSNPNPLPLRQKETLPSLRPSNSQDPNLAKRKIGRFSSMYNSIHQSSTCNSAANSNYGRALESVVDMRAKNAKPNSKPVTIDMLKDKLMKTTSELSQSDASMAQLHEWFQNNSRSKMRTESRRSSQTLVEDPIRKD